MFEIFKNARLLIQTTASDAYTCPADTTSVVISIQVANTSAINEEVTLWWTDASASDAVTHLVKDVIIPGQSSFAPLGGKACVGGWGQDSCFRPG
jgi:hypothetical protein